MTNDQIHIFLISIQCGGKIESVANPLINIVAQKSSCPFKSSGCEWIFAQTTNITSHTSECKYRPYKCIGRTMNLWKWVSSAMGLTIKITLRFQFIYCHNFRCDWNGLQKDVADHMQQVHLSGRQVFKHWHFGVIPYVPAKDTVIIHLINAFNKKFLFFYVSFASSLNVHFVVQLLGRRCDAEKYMIEFELGAELRKLKFFEPCYSDADDLLILLNTKQTMTIQKDYFKQYANSHDRVGFQFVLKRKTAVIEENRQKEEYFKVTMLTGEANGATRNLPQIFPKPSPTPLMQQTPRPTNNATAINSKNNNKHFKNRNKW